VVTVIGWTALNPGDDREQAAQQQAARPVVPPVEPPVPRDLGAPRMHVPRPYNDAPIKASINRLEREIQLLAEERERTRAQWESEFDDQLQAELDAKTQREALQNELELARQERTQLAARLIELQNLLERIDDEHQALEERLRELEALAEPPEAAP
jgi:hypothetical protein